MDRFVSLSNSSFGLQLSPVISLVTFQVSPSDPHQPKHYTHTDTPILVNQKPLVLKAKQCIPLHTHFTNKSHRLPFVRNIRVHLPVARGIEVKGTRAN